MAWKKMQCGLRRTLGTGGLNTIAYVYVGSTFALGSLFLIDIVRGDAGVVPKATKSWTANRVLRATLLVTIMATGLIDYIVRRPVK